MLNLLIADSVSALMPQPRVHIPSCMHQYTCMISSMPVPRMPVPHWVACFVLRREEPDQSVLSRMVCSLLHACECHTAQAHSLLEASVAWPPLLLAASCAAHTPRTCSNSISRSRATLQLSQHAAQNKTHAATTAATHSSSSSSTIFFFSSSSSSSVRRYRRLTGCC